MTNEKAFSLGLLLGYSILCICQDTVDIKTMEEITVSVNKWAQKVNEVPHKITKITQQQILHHNPQTAADMLAQSGNVFIQKANWAAAVP